MPTVIGIVFVAFGVYCLAEREDWLLGFLMFSALFQASSVINFGTVGIQPFYLAACLFVFSQAKKGRPSRSGIHFRGKDCLIIFGCLGVISALVYPFVFAGIPVYSPKIGIDDGFLYRPPLVFGLGNVAQAAYLVVEVLTVVAATSAIKSTKTRTLYNFCFSFLVGLIFVQFICVLLRIEFPYFLLQNNPGYAMAEVGLDPSARVTGTFSEASGAGLALVIFYAGYFYQFFSGTGSAFKVILAAIAIGLVRSSAALAAMAVSTILILVLHPFYRFPWTIRGPRLAKLMAVLAGAILVLLSPLSATLREYTTEKNETLSFIHRTAADMFSLQLSADTHWLGVGLGSNRPSSLIASLLSTVGIPGLIIFLLLIIQVARNAKGEHAWLRWSLFAAAFDMALGGPDITQPVIWLVMILAAHYGTTHREGGASVSSRGTADGILQSP
jgi:hypothetical protein